MTKETRSSAIPQGVDALNASPGIDEEAEHFDAELVEHIEMIYAESIRRFMKPIRDRLLDATKIAWLALVVASVAVFCGEYRTYQRAQAAVSEIEKHREGWRAKVAQVEQMKDELSQRNAKAAQLILQLEALQRRRTPPQVSPNRISPNADEVSSL